MINYYKTLHISTDATSEEIKTAFRKLIKEFHPDVSKDYDKQKLSNIINAYKILSNASSRLEYNKKILANKRLVKIENEKYYKLPLSRVQYNFRLSDLAKKRLLRKQIKRKDRFYHYGKSEKVVTDITVFITEFEAFMGAVAQIHVPAKTICGVCFGEDRYCCVCNGLGKVHTTEKICVLIPAGTTDKTVISVDLKEIKDRPKFLYFKLSFIKIKVKIIENPKLLGKDLNEGKRLNYD